MDIGKVPNKLLNKLVLDKFKPSDKRVILGGGVGEDFGVLDLGGDYCVLSSDPITGSAIHAGRAAVHVACNDIATCGIKPVAILTTLLLPPGASEEELGVIVDDIAAAAGELGVSVIGGHTEVTDAVTRVLISVTAIGAAKMAKYVTTGGAAPGDSIVMTKSAALEGASLLASEREQELVEHFGKAFVDGVKQLSNEISVVGEGVIAGEFGVSAMHDVTEGGVLGAVWEMAEAAGKGVAVRKDHIEVRDDVRRVCGYFDIDVYRLISSGSMLIATDKPGDLITALGRYGVLAREIAMILSDPQDRYVLDGGKRVMLQPPEPDELYKALKSKNV